MQIEASAGGHLVRVLSGGTEMASCDVADLHRLLKRPGTIIAASPIEIRNEHRTITIRVRGRMVGQVEKHLITPHM